MRPYVKVYKEFGLVQRDLIQFFRTADKMVCFTMKICRFVNDFPNPLKSD